MNLAQIRSAIPDIFHTQKKSQTAPKTEPYAGDGSMGDILILCVCHFVILYICTVTDFSAAEKDRGVIFCMRGQLLSAMSFSHFGELWLAGSYGGGITSGMSYRN